LIGDNLFVQKNSEIIIKLPPNDSIVEELQNYEILIDSSGKYIVDEQPISKNELENDIRVQIEKDVKLILEITVHPKSKSEVLLDLIDLAKQNGIKVKLKQKNL
jgi:biopolymer transport protein ExbD